MGHPGARPAGGTCCIDYQLGIWLPCQCVPVHLCRYPTMKISGCPRPIDFNSRECLTPDTVAGREIRRASTTSPSGTYLSTWTVGLASRWLGCQRVFLHALALVLGL
jgi:hypothetical protein